MKSEGKFHIALMVFVTLLVIVSWYFYLDGKASLNIVSMLTIAMLFTFLALLYSLKKSEKNGSG